MIGHQTVAAGPASRRVRLTKRAVDAARYRGTNNERVIFWDTELRRFGLRVFPSGQKSFVIFYRTRHRQQRLFTLGTYPALTVTQARSAAQQKLGEAAGGDDPAGERATARRAATVGELADRYVTEYAELHKRSWKVDRQRIRDWIRPAWGTRPAIAITRGDVAELHRKIGATSTYTANRTVMLVSKMFTWAEEQDEGQGMVPAGHPNPARRFKKFEERSRERFLTQDEVRRLIAALDAADENLYVRAFFRLAFLLGTRKQELLAAQWSWVDLKTQVLALPATATKGKRPHVIPLPAIACHLLASLPREQGNPYVFPGAKPGRPRVNIEDAWERALTAAKLTNVHFHDVRRTVGSWIAQRTGNLELVANVLNHRDPRTTKVYARFLPSHVRNALEDHSRAIDAAMRAPAEQSS